MAEALRHQLLDTSRGRIVALLRTGALTADDIAERLTLTASAVRAQLSAMEGDGVVRKVGKRPAITRPSHLFELTPEIEILLSKAYVPLLMHLVDVFADALPPKQVEGLLRRTGRALARELSQGTPVRRGLKARVDAASRLLNEQLGATTRVETNGGLIIRGSGCPLAAVTGKRPGVCLALESLVSEIVGVAVRQCCDREERPRCCFRIDRAGARPRRGRHLP
jgi:DeoR family suf operon transcriptional repressor